MNIIRSAVFQLTIWYLVIIMALSIGFSLVLYRLSDVELNRGLRRQQDIFLNQTVPRLPGFDQFRQTQILESRGHLQANLLLFNLVVLLLGGAASYFLARRTLRPIAEAMEAQSRFTADASHELRTPLTAMQTEIEVALRDPLLTKEIAEGLLKSNLEEVAKLKALSDGLLRLTREDGQRDIWETLAIKAVADEAISRVLPLATTKEIAIENHIGNFEVQGDRVSLVELLVILIDNAIKYSDAKTTVRIASHQHGQTVSIAVIDQGHGIKASDLPHIFDRFYRADLSRSKEKTDGYGLGLSIAKKIVDVHGGTISAKSVLDKGSTFFVRLPLASSN